MCTAPDESGGSRGLRYPPDSPQPAMAAGSHTEAKPIEARRGNLHDGIKGDRVSKRAQYWIELVVVAHGVASGVCVEKRCSMLSKPERNPCTKPTMR